MKELGVPLPARSLCMDMVMSGAAIPSWAAVSSTSIASSAAGCSDGIAMEQPPPQPRFARTFAAVMVVRWAVAAPVWLAVVSKIGRSAAA